MSALTFSSTRAPYAGFRPKEVIKRAKAGSVPHIEELQSRTRSEYSLELIDVFLYHLTTEGPLWSDLPDRSTASLVALLSVTRWCPERLIPAVSKRLAKAAVDILECVCGYLGSFPTSLDVDPCDERWIHASDVASRVLLALIDFHHDVRKAFSNQPLLQHICLGWWLTLCDGEPLLYISGSRDVDPHYDDDDTITRLFFLILDWNAWGIAGSLVAEKLCSADVFFERTIKRLEALSDVSSLKALNGCFPSGTVENQNIRYTIMGLDALGEEDPAIYDLIPRSRLPEAAMRTLSVATRRLALQQNLPSVESCQRRGKMLELLDLSSTVASWLTYSPAYGATCARGIIVHGVVDILGECISTPKCTDHDEETPSSFGSLLRLLMQFSAFPRVASVLFPKISTVLIPAVRGMEEDDVTRAVSRLMVRVGSFYKFVPEDKRLAICHNLNHHRRTEGCALQVRPRHRTCSRCHSVAYCSTECQQEDWVSFHRRECRRMHWGYLERKHSDTWYSHRTHAFQLAILRHYYAQNSYLWVARAGPCGPHPDDVQKIVVTMQVAADSEEDSTFNSLDEYVDHTRRIIPKFFEARFESLVKTFRESKLLGAKDDAEDAVIKTDRLGLVNGVFWFGDMEMNVVALFRRAAGVEAPAKPEDFTVEGSMVFMCKPLFHETTVSTPGEDFLASMGIYIDYSDDPDARTYIAF